MIQLVATKWDVYTIIRNIDKINIDKIVLVLYKRCYGVSYILYNGNGYGLGLISFPSKSLEKEREVKGFRCGCGPWS